MGEQFGEWRQEPQDDCTPAGGVAARSWDSGYQPFASQAAFHTTESRFNGYSGPVGSGKSAALCRHALKLAYLNPGLPGVLGSSTYKLLRDVTRAAFLEMLDAIGEPYTFRASFNEVFLHGPRSTVRFRSLDKPTSLVGSNLAWFGVDELTYCKEDAWKRLEARLRHPRAKVRQGFAAWTPKGFDWVYNRFIGPKKIEGYAATLAKPGENTALPPDYYESLGRSYDSRFHAQEVLGQYLSVFAGQAYHAFSRSLNVAPVEFNPALPLALTCDFNINPMCWALCQVDGGTIRVLDEMYLPNCNTFAACDEFLMRSEEYWRAAQPTGWAAGTRPLSVVVYGDASADSRKTAADRTDWAILREWFGRRADKYTVEFRLDRSNPAVKARVNSTNAMLCNHKGERRLLLHPRCVELTADYEQVAWAADPSGNSLSYLNGSDHERTHISDAVGYLIWKEFGIRQKGGFGTAFIGV